jgi:hypothetical protein
MDKYNKLAKKLIINESKLPKRSKKLENLLWKCIHEQDIETECNKQICIYSDKIDLLQAKNCPQSDIRIINHLIDEKKRESWHASVMYSKYEYKALTLYRKLIGVGWTGTLKW